MGGTSTSNGFWESTGLIREQYGQLGYEHGKLGYPAGPEKCVNGNCQQEYEYGTIFSYSDGHTSYTVKER